jgi:hypothetical protein
MRSKKSLPTLSNVDWALYLTKGWNMSCTTQVHSRDSVIWYRLAGTIENYEALREDEKQGWRFIVTDPRANII